MMFCVLPPSAQTRKLTPLLVPPDIGRHDGRMTTMNIHLDRSLRLAVRDGTGNPLAAVRLTRNGAEGLADALLEFCGNRISGLSGRPDMTVAASSAGTPAHPAKHRNAKKEQHHAAD